MFKPFATLLSNTFINQTGEVCNNLTNSNNSVAIKVRRERTIERRENRQERQLRILQRKRLNLARRENLLRGQIKRFGIHNSKVQNQIIDIQAIRDEYKKEASRLEHLRKQDIYFVYRQEVCRRK